MNTCLVCGAMDTIILDAPGRFLYPGRIAVQVCHKKVAEYTYVPSHANKDIQAAMKAKEREA